MKYRSAVLAVFVLPFALASAVNAAGLGEPCTTEPEAKWQSVEAIVKVVRDHGYEVMKSKVKNRCVEVYARDKQGNRVEFFIDPVTGNPVGLDWKNPPKGGAT